MAAEVLAEKTGKVGGFFLIARAIVKTREVGRGVLVQTDSNGSIFAAGTSDFFVSPDSLAKADAEMSCTFSPSSAAVPPLVADLLRMTPMPGNCKWPV